MIESTSEAIASVDTTCLYRKDQTGGRRTREESYGKCERPRAVSEGRCGTKAR